MTISTPLPLCRAPRTTTTTDALPSSTRGRVTFETVSASYDIMLTEWNVQLRACVAKAPMLPLDLRFLHEKVWQIYSSVASPTRFECL